MIKIGIISDTHGYLDEKLFQYFESCAEIWHAGDIGNLEVADQLAAFRTLRAVYGNVDNHKLRTSIPLHQRFMCEEVSIWITHIGGYPGHYALNIRDEIKVNPPKIFISGHSHILKVMPDKKLNLLHINPGAAGFEGFHKVRTAVRFTIDGKEIKQLEVIELGPRSIH